jgi:hypothetical protein
VADHPLDGAEAKIARAWEHRKALRAEISRFLKTEPYPVVVDLDPQTGWHVARLRVLKEPPLLLSIIAGEMAYEYVSALNHLVWELAARKLGRNNVWKYRMGIQFPIAASPESFLKPVLVRKRYVSKRALAIIEGLQPYNGRDGLPGAQSHPLWLIKNVADSDKHRILAPRITRFTITGLEFAWNESIAAGPEIEPLIQPGQRLDDGTELERIRFSSGNNQANVRVDRQLPTDILLGSGEWALTLLDFGNTHAVMRRALRHLEPLFPPRPDSPSG